MALCNVIGECVIGNRHYTRPTREPVDIVDAVAEPLVEAGVVELVIPADEPTSARRRKD